MTRSIRTHLTKGHSSQAGITLIEVLAAMVILAVGILAMAPMMVLSVTGSQFSNDVTSLASAAQRQIEIQIAKGTFATIPYSETTLSPDGSRSVVTEVTDDSVDPAVPSGVYEISVTVSWVDDANLDRSMMFTTYAAKK